MRRLCSGLLLLWPAILGQRLARQDERLYLRTPMRRGLRIQPPLLSRGIARSPCGKMISPGPRPLQTSAPVMAADIASSPLPAAVFARGTLALLLQAVLLALLFYSRNSAKLLAGILRRQTSGLRLAGTPPSPPPSSASAPAPAHLASRGFRLREESLPGLLLFLPLGYAVP